jgi:hypothetical protein
MRVSGAPSAPGTPHPVSPGRSRRGSRSPDPRRKPLMKQALCGLDRLPGFSVRLLLRPLLEVSERLRGERRRAARQGNAGGGTDQLLAGVGARQRRGAPDRRRLAQQDPTECGGPARRASRRPPSRRARPRWRGRAPPGPTGSIQRVSARARRPRSGRPAPTCRASRSGPRCRAPPRGHPPCRPAPGRRSPLKRITQSRSVWRSIPAARAAASGTVHRWRSPGARPTSY